MCRYSCGQTSLVNFKQPAALKLRADMKCRSFSLKRAAFLYKENHQLVEAVKEKQTPKTDTF